MELLKKCTLPLAVAFLVFGCSNNADEFTFSNLDRYLQGIAENGSEDVEPIDAICDPLGGSEETAPPAFRGVLTSKSKSIAKNYKSVDDYIENGSVLSDSLFFKEINVEPRRFDQGFSTEGGALLTDEDGEPLIEYFSLHLLGKINITAEQAGRYQFALLSDDGSRLSHVDAQGNTLDIMVNNDGLHSPTFKCSSVYDLKAGDSIPVRLDYFQGPRHHIALMMMWRKVEAGDAETDEACGTGGVEHFYNTSVFPSEPKKPFLDIVDRGWEVVPSTSFEPIGNGGICM